MSNNLQELINEIQFKLKLTQEEIADRIEYSRPYLSNAIKSNAKGKILEAVKREFSEVLQNSTINKEYKPEDLESNALEPQADYTNGKLINAILAYQETIRDLAKQGIVLADGNKVMAEGYKVLADANKVLADNNTLLISKSNFGSPQHVSSVLEPYLKTIAVALAGKVWSDENAGLLELNRILIEYLEAGIKSDK